MGEYDKLTTIRLPSWIFEELKKRGLNVSALTRSLLESYLRRGGADGYSVLAVELKEVKRKVEEAVNSLSTLKEALQKIGELEKVLAKKQLERKLWLEGLMWERFKDFFDETNEDRFKPDWRIGEMVKLRLEGFAKQTGLSLEEVKEIFRETFPENCLIRRVFEKQKSL